MLLFWEIFPFNFHLNCPWCLLYQHFTCTEIWAVISRIFNSIFSKNLPSFYSFLLAVDTRNHEESEVPLSSQAHKSVYYSFRMQAETWNSWVRDKGLHHSRHNKQQKDEHVCGSPCPQVLCVQPGRLRWCLHTQRVVLWESHPELRELNFFFIMSSLQEALSLLYWTVSTSAPYSRRRHLCLSCLRTT